MNLCICILPSSHPPPAKEEIECMPFLEKLWTLKIINTEFGNKIKTLLTWTSQILTFNTYKIFAS